MYWAKVFAVRGLSRALLISLPYSALVEPCGVRDLCTCAATSLDFVPLFALGKPRLVLNSSMSTTCKCDSSCWGENVDVGVNEIGTFMIADGDRM
jgi:hypothetical protein